MIIILTSDLELDNRERNLNWLMESQCDEISGVVVRE